MRRTTPCVFLSLKAPCSAAVTRSALASPFGSITPTTSTSAVCFPAVKPSCARQSSAINRSTVRYANPSSLKKMPQRRERRCSFNAASASFSITSRSQLPSVMQIALHDDAAVALFHGDRNKTLLEARTAQTPAGVRCVGRTVRRAYQMQAPDIKKLSGLPVQFHGHVRAAVEVGIDPPPVAHGERRLGLAAHIDLEAHPVTQVRQIRARANYEFSSGHRVDSSILSMRARILAIRRASGRQGLQETPERLGQRRAKRHRFPGQRMAEFQFSRMQEHALQAAPGQIAVEFEIAVLVVAGDGKTEMSKMHADLMGASGKQFRRQQG